MKAVILAAGLGSRLGFHRPKGLLTLGKETLVGRSLRLLRQAGLDEPTLVVGHLAQEYAPICPSRLYNPDYASTGSLRSLLIAYRQLQDDLVVLESDLLYEPRALDRLLQCPNPDVILASGRTHAGDEVYVDAPHDRLRNLSKTAITDREFVGINRFSKELLQELESWGETRPAAHYETDGLVALCHRRTIHVEFIPDLIWCEIDDPDHLRRAENQIYPQLENV